MYQAPLLKKLLLAQLGLLLLVPGLLALHARSVGVSTLMGMLVMMCANVYFMKRLFGGTKVNFDPTRFLVNFYLGEVGKLLIVAVGTVLAAKFLALTWWAYILGVAIMQCSMWLTPLWIKRQRTAKE